MSDTKHTRKIHTYKLPNGEWPIRDDDGHLIASVPPTSYSVSDEEDARDLVHRYNTHPELLEALEKAHAFLEPGGPSGFGTTSMESVRFAEKARELRNELQSALATARA